LNALIKKMWEF